MITTRFAPSPTGFLHLGHAYSALFAARAGQRFLLRIEDIDPVRCKPGCAEAIEEDLSWLGLSWERPVRFQSQHLADYEKALSDLKAGGLVYPCFCTRREVASEAAAAGQAPHSDSGYIYGGTCRDLSVDQRAELMTRKPYVWRLDSAKAMDEVGPLFWQDQTKGQQTVDPALFGDVVLARKDVPTSYHLSVVYDDALQGVNLVTRGMDLFGVTGIHRLLQALLGLDAPLYHHHSLLRDAEGKRFAKRDQSITLRALREAGWSAQKVLDWVDTHSPMVNGAALS